MIRNLGLVKVALNSSQLIELRLRLLSIDSGAEEEELPPVFSGTLVFPTATVGVPYSFNAAFLFNSGGVPDSYALETGADGNGIAFNQLTCVFSGTPIDDTDLNGISIIATNLGGISEASNISNLVVSNVPVETSVFNGVWRDINEWNDNDIWGDI